MCVLWILFDTVSQSKVVLIINNCGKNVLCEGKKSYIHISLVLKETKEHCVELSHGKNLEADW